MVRSRVAAPALLLAAALALAAGAASAAPAQPTAPSPEPPKSVLPFIEDDYARALERARQSKLPIFIEAWAPW
jgi:hypothetical protein